MEKKEKKKKGFISIYEGIGNLTPKIDPTMMIKKNVGFRYWGFRKPKTSQESEVFGGRKSIDVLEVEARKSISDMGTKLENVVEGRKSISHIEKDLENVEVVEKKKMVEARKSLSYIETSLSSVVSMLQVRVLVSDMPGFMQVHAFRCARRTYDSMEKFSSKHMASTMKKEFDKVYGPAWHCIVGSDFGSYVTHSTGCFLYFSMEKLYFLVFKTKVKKATG
ncbi:Dynein light chain, type 1/2 [Dillenia turbinata]|uniref:Dynein light chain, type 1/2 n=1 Tax=Dillenia turbinata TaxID=194707 RepID=A0AAN8WEE5_9MAGN